MGQEEWDLLVKTRNAGVIRFGSRATCSSTSRTAARRHYTQGGPTLLVGTIGRKSGEERITAANFMPAGDDVIVVGSIAGLENHPQWALNLDARREGWVQVKARRWQIIARKVVGEEREALWPKLTAFFPLWGHFQKYSDREFMVFILSPKSL
jgi:deazaflavin-dependent oxidoreductase (nitroreductase family)